MRIHTILTLVLLLQIISCSDSSESSALKLINAYNRASIQAYRTSDFSALKDVAGDKELRIISVLVETRRNAGLVLESTLEELKVTSVKSSGQHGMIVETKERWRYHDRSLSPGKPPGKVIIADMTMRYECSKESGNWKVMKVTTIPTNQR